MGREEGRKGGREEGGGETEKREGRLRNGRGD
jgi:hypothetical protein